MRVRTWAALISLALLAGLGVAALAPAEPKEVVGRFAEAAGFADAALLRPGDRAAEVMAQRARELAQNPPSPEWGGVFVSLQK